MQRLRFIECVHVIRRFADPQYRSAGDALGFLRTVPGDGTAVLAQIHCNYFESSAYLKTINTRNIASNLLSIGSELYIRQQSSTNSGTKGSNK